jgi:hypothetical protein
LFWNAPELDDSAPDQIFQVRAVRFPTRLDGDGAFSADVEPVRHCVFRAAKPFMR